MAATPEVKHEFPAIDKPRIARLDAAFTEQYGTKPSFYVRAPGRVNLIGEHIDYCGYAVLPMAIEQSILMAVSEDPNPRVTVTNTDPRFETYRSEIDDIRVDQSKPKWYNYVLAGFLGIKERANLDKLKGMQISVDGNVPPSAGLSSSSALVCAAALSTSHLNKYSISKMEIANLCAKSERYVGTEGGGMDQAICFLGDAGTAKLIEFNPLKAFDVNLPKGSLFVIANSLSDINKAATNQYNTRVVECRLATKVLAKHLGQDWKNLRLLGHLQNVFGITANEMADKVREHLHPEPYKRQEICSFLGLSDSELAEECLSQNTLHLQEFKLYHRALHVYTESQRVRDFKKICDENGSADTLGDLMNQSHESCRDQYECSHPDLDELVRVAIAAGALGSRLTGAGWGGCTVSLVSEENVESFLKHIEENFYSKHPERKARHSTSVFKSLPAEGAAVYVL